MSILNNSLLLGADAGAGGYQVSRSIRLNASDSAFLSRTPASAGNRKTWTWSGWVKRTKLGEPQILFVCFVNGSNYSTIEFYSTTDQIRIANVVAGVEKAALLTTQVFRDPSSWYHIVVASNSSSSLKLYVNGSEVTQFSVTTGPDASDWFYNSTNAHDIGRYSSGYYFSGYLANVEFVDGAALTPSSFAETNATTGQWVPKAYTGSYGTNGFKLSFSNNASTTTISQDSSGNNNHWTANNISVTAGAGNDSLTDTPTSYGTDTGAGGQVRGNYATLNPLTGGTGTAPTNGNLDFSASDQRYGTIGISSGKWYWEITMSAVANSGSQLGVSNKPQETIAAVTGLRSYSSSGNKYDGSTNTTSAYGASYTTGDIVGVAFDRDAGTLTFYKNGSSQGQAFSGITSDTWFPLCRTDAGTTGSYNFGQRPFAYTAPSGFKALCDTSLPAPTIARPSTVMDVKLYTGNGTTNNITGLGFSPDLVWIKSRSDGFGHRLFDTVRPLNGALYTNSTDAERTVTTNDNFTAFNSGGFSLGATSSTNGSNASGSTYVAWAWDAGSSTVTNTQGSITSQVRANASAGFSIVSYTGNGVQGATVGHGLGVAPSMVIYKSRDGSLDWLVYHSALGATQGIYLNQTLAAITSANFFNNTAPNSTTLYLNSAPPAGQTNTNGNRHLAYCFAPVSGYSSFGSYTGNGSADGPFVFTGFRPRWVLIKGSSFATTGWAIYDAVRNTFNVANNLLTAESSSAETNYPEIDLLSNGFKLRGTNPTWNYSGQTHIYAAFAESSFAHSRAR